MLRHIVIFMKTATILNVKEVEELDDAIARLLTPAEVRQIPALTPDLCPDDMKRSNFNI